MSRLLFCFCFISSYCYAQHAGTPVVKRDSISDFRKYVVESETIFSLLLGYNYLTYGFAEAGVGILKEGRVGYHPSSAAAFLSSEIKVDKKTIIGPKIGCWISGGVGGMAMGASAIYYTDFNGASLRARPEIGFGTGPVKLTYGYNIAVTNKDFKGINTHIVSLGIMVKLKQLKEVRTIDTNRKPRQWAMRDTSKLIGIDTVVTRNSLLFVVGMGGWQYGMGEAGIAFYAREYGGSYTEETQLLYVGCEYLQRQRPVYGFKLGTYVQGKKDFGLCGGAPVIYYTDFRSNSWSLRFSGGIHYRSIMLLYGYNLFFSKYRYDEIANNNISLFIGLRAARLKPDYTYIKHYASDDNP